MAKPQGTGAERRMEATDAERHAELEASAVWLEDEHVTLIEDGAEPAPEMSGSRRFDHTQRIWCRST